MPNTERVKYNQRTTLVENILKYVRRIGAGSLLDIGAGSCATAVALSRQVGRYHAVEQDLECATRLRASGLAVTHGVFPLDLDDRYDFVLSSHSLPEGPVTAYEPFIESAWRSVQPGGMLLVVTFKGSAGALASVKGELFCERAPESPELEEILRCCGRCAPVAVARVNSFIEANDAGALANYLERWLTGDSNLRRAVRPDFLDLLEARYKVRHGLFVFPVEHLFISCRSNS